MSKSLYINLDVITDLYTTRSFNLEYFKDFIHDILSSVLADHFTFQNIVSISGDRPTAAIVFNKDSFQSVLTFEASEPLYATLTQWTIQDIRCISLWLTIDFKANTITMPIGIKPEMFIADCGKQMAIIEHYKP